MGFGKSETLCLAIFLLSFCVFLVVEDAFGDEGAADSGTGIFIAGSIGIVVVVDSSSCFPVHVVAAMAC